MMTAHIPVFFHSKRRLARTLIACAVAALGTVTAQVRPTQAAPVRAGTPVNCSGYVAGMTVLAQDVQNFVDLAPTLLPSAAGSRALGVSRELRTVLHANGKPVDNYKVVGDMAQAILYISLSVETRVSTHNITKANALLDTSRADLTDVHVLLREICLPSKIRRLPCTGSCVVSLVGSGRVVDRARPWATFIVPTNYQVHYAWNCQAASAGGKGMQIFFQDFSDAEKTRTAGGIALGTRIVNALGVQRSGTIVRDDEAPDRKFLLIDAEQACQWQITVVKG